MNTIHTTVDIPQSRLLNLNVQLPEELPTGKAEIVLMISPINDAKKSHIITPARKLAKGEERFEGLAGILSNSRAFEGDPVEIVRKMRDEW